MTHGAPGGWKLEDRATSRYGKTDLLDCFSRRSSPWHAGLGNNFAQTFMVSSRSAHMCHKCHNTSHVMGPGCVLDSWNWHKIHTDPLTSIVLVRRRRWLRPWASRNSTPSGAVAVLIQWTIVLSKGSPSSWSPECYTATQLTCGKSGLPSES